ncbi:MAG: RNA-binding transcriptional accessory protein [Melioribacteraceae bacterium]|nr:RNA-binding transcriptional accessory protein [Melioribacteraceae bacterium]MCF8354204.1 RNA-binding transcriptional accessory protein [Melioribacteraceae bacterium]MCF8392850.1 RNA-binding transcriptional accessory protein [Melioribacteraceae bacterium]MCF8418664.1 RNA-binding transcriptional accessory protein [Melioribacteraceae bacterium]
MLNIPNVISNELNIKIDQINQVITLFGEGATIPFIVRYRKEKTGGLNEDDLRNIEERLTYLNLLEDRKKTVLNSIDEQGKLTDELRKKIEDSLKLQEVEDLYLPYKPKRKTRGTVAKAKGLEPLALFILDNPKFKGSLDEEAAKYIDEEKEVVSIDDAIQGAMDIIAEMISEDADVRQVVREFLLEQAQIVSQKSNVKVGETAPNKKDVYEVYHDFKIELSKIKPHQTLAINRGEREKFLKVILSYDKPGVLQNIFETYFDYEESVFIDLLNEVVDDSFTRLVYPSIEREVRNHLTDIADLHAIEIFASNLRQLLLQPPIDKIIMGIDPGFVSGSKIAIIDKTGKYIDGATIYPHPPQKRTGDAKTRIVDFVNKYGVELIAIGNGTASRETELLVAEIINENNLNCHYLIINEAGASVYSASAIAKHEFPDLEASQRGNISIARRVLDPLAELVKIDPKSIGVGLYQHDVDQKMLVKKLDDVIVSCVNYVGVDLNTASSSLLTHVSGLNSRIANNIISHRESIGRFTNRHQLMDVKGVGAKLFEQAAGFLKISNGEILFDNTFIHPESYEAAQKLLNLCSVQLDEIKQKGKLVGMFVDKEGKLKVAETIGVGEPTLEDILEDLEKPGRDPREEMPKPILRSDVLKMEDLQEGMKLKGTVRNIVDFGAFVDIGVKQDGLIHISQMANKFIKHPLEIVSVGDVIDVTVMNIDIDKGRIALSMK